MNAPVVEARPEHTLVATLRRGDHGELRVTTAVFEGATLVHVRWWHHVEGALYTPTAKGIALRLADIPLALDALVRATEGEPAHPAPARPALPPRSRPLTPIEFRAHMEAWRASLRGRAT